MKIADRPDGSWDSVQLVFRCDASREIGHGHLSRCLTVAATARMRGAVKVVFVTRPYDTDAVARVRAAGHEVVLVPCDASENEDLVLTAAQCARRSGAIVTDSHRFTAGYYADLRDGGRATLSFDDYAGVAYESDIVVNHNPSAPMLAWRVAPHTRLLLGLDYLPLRRQFREAERARPCVPQPESMVVNVGGAPSIEVLVTIVEGLARAVATRDVDVTVVSGYLPGSPDTLRRVTAVPPHWTVVADPPDMAARLTSADMAIVNGSLSGYEAAAVGVPVIMVPMAENQIDAVHACALGGMALELPKAEDLQADDVADSVTRLMADAALRESLGLKARARIDGRGADRILDSIGTLLGSI